VPALIVAADSIRSPEMRHEVPLAVPDPFFYLESDGRRVVAVTSMEAPRVREALPEIEVLLWEELGLDELLAQGLKGWEATRELLLRACGHLALDAAAVPETFPVLLADHLRANGIDVRPDPELFAARRRVKSETELAGIRRAQRACEEAMDAARDLLRRADSRDGGLVVDGEPLTSERLRAAVEDVFLAHGVVADESIVSHGPQTAIGHELGHGQLRADEPIVLDLFPRDRETGCYADMTRTFVVGEPSDELREYHRLVREALERSTAQVGPGVNGRKLFEDVCELFREHGHKTQLHKDPQEVLVDGFFHSLGHGVGLDVHERPNLGRVGDDLVSGDVITLEPGLYRSGYGGVRLEDLVLVTETGPEVLTNYPYEFEP
jgi:Xaa-Pro aminopeptidase